MAAVFQAGAKFAEAFREGKRSTEANAYP